jgi:hypothetical protein
MTILRFALSVWTLFVHVVMMTSLVAYSQETAKDSVKNTVEEKNQNAEQLLFDGKALTGWEGNLDWFRIEDECIVAGRLDKSIPHNEFLCTEAKFENFELKLEVKLKGQGDNAGVQFRTSRIPNQTEVSGFQCDVGNAFGRPVWGALYDESRRNKMLAEGDPSLLPGWLKVDDWNELTVRATGDKIQIWLNGHPTVEYTEQDASIAKTGIIALQIHSGPPTEAWYRNIRIKPIQ